MLGWRVFALTLVAFSLTAQDDLRPTYRYVGRDFRLTDVDGYVVKDILA